MPKNGTALAVLKNASHVTLAGVYDTFADFRAAIQLHTKAVWLDVAAFVWAYGSDMEWLTLSEFRAEFGPSVLGDE
jgi:hypothetical protein